MIKLKVVMTEELTHKFLVGISVTKVGRFSLTKAEMYLDMFIASFEYGAVKWHFLWAVSRITSERSGFNSLCYFDTAWEAVLQLCPYNTGLLLGLKKYKKGVFWTEG